MFLPMEVEPGGAPPDALPPPPDAPAPPPEAPAILVDAPEPPMPEPVGAELPLPDGAVIANA
jgi:hypothetical protein